MAGGRMGKLQRSRLDDWEMRNVCAGFIILFH